MTKKGEATTLEFDSAVYRLEAIKKAAYRFGGRCVAQIEVPAPGCVRVSLEPKGSDDDVGMLVGEFRNEVLDQELREVVAKETEAIRNLIVLQAFSRTSLLDSDGETGDIEKDPLGIRKPDAR